MRHEIVSTARELLGPNGENWVQDTPPEDGTQHCVMTALRESFAQHVPEKQVTDAWNEFCMHCNKLAGELFPDRVIFQHHPMAASFNDDPATTFIDIEQFLDKLAVSDA